MKKLFQFLFIKVFRHTPESWGGVRRFCLHKYIKFCGKKVSVGRKCFVHKNTEIGDYSGIGYACEINNGVKIGNNVMMGPNVLIYTQNHNTSRVDIPMREQGMRDMKPVVIEDDVWIGARVCILPGVTIGKGSVIGACAVVSKNVPEYSVVVGNPGQVVKMRK
ncbi:MAG: acetyltransferase [Clostridia bacterium]|nr:acetyltransferase [Clostridia bacterium]